MVVFVVSAVWFPHSLEQVKRLGYDFTIFYNGPADPGYFYVGWTTVLFEPLRVFPHDIAFTIHYGVCAVAFWLLLWNVSRTSELLGWLTCVLGVYPYLLSQELGGLTPILAYLCTTAAGSLLAGVIKPYLFGFAVYHALSRFQRTRDSQTRIVDDAHL